MLTVVCLNPSTDAQGHEVALLFGFLHSAFHVKVQLILDRGMVPVVADDLKFLQVGNIPSQTEGGFHHGTARVGRRPDHRHVSRKLLAWQALAQDIRYDDACLGCLLDATAKCFVQGDARLSGSQLFQRLLDQDITVEGLQQVPIAITVGLVAFGAYIGKIENEVI